MNTRIFIALTLLLATPELQSADTPDTADGASEWSWARMILVKRGRKYDRGIALYMTNEQSPGVAFRCQRDKLYAVVSVKPVDFNSLLTEWFRNPAEWKVEYRIDGEPLRAETWVWAYRGKVFVSPPGDSVKDLFEAARRGATLKFTRRKGDPVSIDIPAGDPALFDGFISKCGLPESSTA
ncbi:MAG: hypothetical protein OER91_01500 [Gammaproteobacteria bacterium]|nr:hypothetical protein [Gammaproteobacteria bacterium]